MTLIIGTIGDQPFCLTLGDPVREIDVRGKVVAFEDHRIFGPMPVHRKTHEPLKTNPSLAFYDAWERWKIGGKKLDGIRCVVPEWCHRCKGEGMTVYGVMAHTCKRCGGIKIEGDKAEASQ